ncbi:MAG TPA: NAD(P)-dependent oxidoreductase [Candidatus Thermoplasmatota archaeon]|nr:NAD(P)-dependent oxidoreductase [Candidatus Thermoplasmatota archaeon]
MAQTVLVTGAGGFVGRAVVRLLAASSGVRVVALGGPMLDGVRTLEGRLHDLKPHTWTDAGITHIDSAIHLAAFTPKDQQDEDPERCYRDNLLGTQRLIESLSAVTRFVHVSTLDVYRPPSANQMINEDSPVSPRSLYAASKLLSEVAVQLHSKQSGMEHCVVRLGHVYGPGEERYRKLIPEAIRHLRAGRPVPIMGGGTTERDLLFVDDAAEALRRVALRDTCPVGPINVVSGRSHTVREIVDRLIGVAQKGEIAIIHTPTSAAVSLRFDNRRMLNALGTWTLVDLNEGLRREWAEVQGP